MNNKYIYALVESYVDSTQQMNKILKDAKRYERAAEEAREARKQFICEILGKAMYNRLENEDKFAPIPLNALKFERKDFDNISTDINVDKTEKFVEKMSVKYIRNEFALKDNGYGVEILKTDVVFRTMDEIINFFYNVLACYVKTYRNEDINWKPIVKKFRAYLKS